MTVFATCVCEHFAGSAGGRSPLHSYSPPHPAEKQNQGCRPRSGASRFLPATAPRKFFRIRLESPQKNF